MEWLKQKLRSIYEIELTPGAMSAWIFTALGTNYFL